MRYSQGAVAPRDTFTDRPWRSAAFLCAQVVLSAWLHAIVCLGFKTLCLYWLWCLANACSFSRFDHPERTRLRLDHMEVSCQTTSLLFVQNARKASYLTCNRRPGVTAVPALNTLMNTCSRQAHFRWGSPLSKYSTIHT